MVNYMAVFKMNLTSKIIQKVASEVLIDLQESSILELGCGDCNISRYLYALTPRHNFFASDISAEAISQAKKQNSAFPIELKVGSGFSPWASQKFDVVICDISGISETIGKISGWYDNVPLGTGADGLNQLKAVIEAAPAFLNKNGFFLIPVISLADTNKQLRLLRARFNSVVVKNITAWPLPVSLRQTMTSMAFSPLSDNWEINEKFGLWLASTSVAVCKSN
jgi:methylase of polypeptide subunit release factors